tara:strand:- start:38 stop:430 length:393 start_codon:yes stop_codon:yes gene_type:complete
MPLYDIKCLSCEQRTNDIFFRLNDTIICPTCGEGARTIIGPVLTIGPMPSKPLKMESIGREFTSNSELRAYKEANPDLAFHSKDDTSWRNHVDMARNKTERKAKLQGFSDRADKKAYLRKERKKKQELSN